MTSHRPAPAHGFTLPELLGVIVLTSVLAVFAMPSLDGVFGFRDEAWRGELIAALRNARQTASPTAGWCA